MQVIGGNKAIRGKWPWQITVKYMDAKGNSLGFNAGN